MSFLFRMNSRKSLSASWTSSPMPSATLAALAGRPFFEPFGRPAPGRLPPRPSVIDYWP